MLNNDVQRLKMAIVYNIYKIIQAVFHTIMHGISHLYTNHHNLTYKLL